MSRSRQSKPRGGRPLVLLSNDDGIEAVGLRRLYEALAPDADIVVVAPDRERSGTAHAFTYQSPLHYEKVTVHGLFEGYRVSGTPVDCVKFGISFLLPRRPDLVVAGINRGENSGLSAHYSGTVAAAREGAFWEIPSAAFSVAAGGEEHLAAYAAMVPALMKRIFGRTLRAPRGNRVYYNINFPACPPSAVRGVRVTAQSMAFFDDRYETIEVESHPSKKGYVVYGEKKKLEQSNRYDSRALMNNCIAVTPLWFDATHAPSLRRLRGLWPMTGVS